MEDGLVRESGVIFHKIGISDEDSDRGFQGWKMRTLSAFWFTVSYMALISKKAIYFKNRRIMCRPLPFHCLQILQLTNIVHFVSDRVV